MHEDFEADEVTEEEFRELLEVPLKSMGEQYWEHALRVFQGYGPSLSRRVIENLECAVETGAVGDVVNVLESHYNNCECKVLDRDSAGTRTVLLYVEILSGLRDKRYATSP